MSWQGKITFGNSFAAYVGYSSDIKLHQHAAIQLVLSADQEAEISDAQENKQCGKAFMIRPMSYHTLKCDSKLTLIFLEPQSPLAFELMANTEPGDIVALGSEALPFSRDASMGEINSVINDLNKLAIDGFDQRLAMALSILSESPGKYSISEVARKCNLSDSRLRALARQQIQFPLSTWLLWLKLGKSVRELMVGASLSDAALAGGFADQAHFTRTMRRMFGITPTSLLSIFQ